MTMAFLPPFTTVASKVSPSRTVTCALAIPRIAERIKASEVERAMVSATGRVVRHSKNADHTDVHRNFVFLAHCCRIWRRSRQTRDPAISRPTT